jgi:hypothetical protein
LHKDIFDSAGLNSSWEAITFALSQPVSTIIVGCDSIGQLEENILIAKAFRQLTKEEQKEISDKTKKYIRKACFFHKNYGGYDSKKELEEL